MHFQGKKTITNTERGGELKIGEEIFHVQSRHINNSRGIENWEDPPFPGTEVLAYGSSTFHFQPQSQRRMQVETRQDLFFSFYTSIGQHPLSPIDLHLQLFLREPAFLSHFSSLSYSSLFTLPPSNSTYSLLVPSDVQFHSSSMFSNRCLSLLSMSLFSWFKKLIYLYDRPQFQVVQVNGLIEQAIISNNSVLLGYFYFMIIFVANNVDVT